MKLGFIGLGRMGFNIVLNLHDKKIPVVAYNRSPEPVKKIEKYGVEVAFSIEELIEKLPKQKIIWLMVTAGNPVDLVIKELLPHLEKEDIIIDGGNSFYKDSIRRYNHLKKKKIHFVDIGTSGGLSGARHGACLTIGGDKKIFKRIEPIHKAVSAKNGYAYVGSAGAGHFVKMVHNGIEYGVMQSIGEGFGVLEKSPYNLDLVKVAKLYQQGTLNSGFMMQRTIEALEKDPKLSQIEGFIEASGEGQWTVEEAKKQNVPVEIIEASLNFRARSRTDKKVSSSFTARLVAALRNVFGGHPVRHIR